MSAVEPWQSRTKTQRFPLTGLDMSTQKFALVVDDVPANIPLLFVTAHADDDERVKGMELGAVAFVTKPIDPDKLLAHVAECLGIQ